MDNKQSPGDPQGGPVLTQKQALRKELLARRQAMPERAWRTELLQRVMRVWLIQRPDTVIGAYWPIKGEFDPLPALHRWKEDGELLDEPQRELIDTRNHRRREIRIRLQWLRIRKLGRGC